MSRRISGTGAILCAPLLRQMDGELVELLRALEAREWGLATVAGEWRVREVAAHLLDTALRKLSAVLDGCVVETVEIRSAADLVALVNRLNREGVAVYRRLSAPLLVEMMAMACAESAAFHEGLDPFAEAAFGVSWAGEMRSANWFDTARELTERWHHQQQIRLATGREGIMTPELYGPVLDCFLRGLPFAFREAEAVEGTAVEVEVSGECGGVWMLRRCADGWALVGEEPEMVTARVVIPQALAWRVFTKGVGREEALRETVVEGDRAMGERVLGLTAIVG